MPDRFCLDIKFMCYCAKKKKNSLMVPKISKHTTYFTKDLPHPSVVLNPKFTLLSSTDGVFTVSLTAPKLDVLN